MNRAEPWPCPVERGYARTPQCGRAPTGCIRARKRQWLNRLKLARSCKGKWIGSGRGGPSYARHSCWQVSAQGWRKPRWRDRRHLPTRFVDHAARLTDEVEVEDSLVKASTINADDDPCIRKQVLFAFKVSHIFEPRRRLVPNRVLTCTTLQLTWN